MTETACVAKRPEELRAFRISPADTNYFACLYDPLADGASFTLVVEIFGPGGATPPSTHSTTQELFFVLKREGVAVANWAEVAIGPGSSFLLKPWVEHVVRNAGAGKLYSLTRMAPNEGFAELIRGGEEVALDDEDPAVLRGVR